MLQVYLESPDMEHWNIGVEIYTVPDKPVILIGNQAIKLVLHSVNKLLTTVRANI